MLKYIFKSFVYENILPNINNNELAKYIYKLKESSPGVNVSNFNGWQSESISTHNPDSISLEVFKLLNIISQVIDPLKKEFNFKPDLRIDISDVV